MMRDAVLLLLLAAGHDDARWGGEGRGGARERRRLVTPAFWHCFVFPGVWSCPSRPDKRVGLPLPPPHPCVRACVCVCAHTNFIFLYNFWGRPKSWNFSRGGKKSPRWAQWALCAGLLFVNKLPVRVLRARKRGRIYDLVRPTQLQRPIF